jgi:2-oxoacid:acceptor oxidoreductase delta subunit (pyruvate/2-ketoisovalerate family)
MTCPDGALRRHGKKVNIDYDFCKGCGICASECKVKAIAMKKEGPGENE